MSEARKVACAKARLSRSCRSACEALNTNGAKPRAHSSKDNALHGAIMRRTPRQLAREFAR